MPGASPDEPAPPGPLGRFRPRLTLQTLSRGDGLLGLKPSGAFAARAAQVTVARIDWTYAADDGRRWETPAPDEPEPPAELGPDEAQALARAHAAGLKPLPAKALQWRTRAAARGHEHLWSLLQERFFGDFCAEELPLLQAEGWAVVVRPGFAHDSVPVDAWRLGLQAPHDQGSWMLSLGIEVAGETLDLVPLLAELIRRDARWLDAAQIAAIDDQAVIVLRTPNGRRIKAEAAPLKAIVGTMVDLLLNPRGRKPAALSVSALDAPRLEALALELEATQAQRAGPHGSWQLQGRAGLHALAGRLRAAGSPPPVAAPAGFGVSLRAYQLHGLAWLQYLRAQSLAGILADDMGLGKTAQALAHLLVEQQAGRLDLPALVVLPTSLIFNWQAEAARMAPALKLLTLHGPRRKALFAWMGDYDVVLTTYPLLWRDIRALELQAFHLLILDEAQMVKNAAARSARAVRRVKARHRLCITGTPLENHLGELWTQFDFLMPGFLGDVRSFRQLWRNPIEKNAEVLRARLLAQRVRPFILRRLKADVAPELPPKTEIVRRVRLQGRQRALYESVRVAADRQVKKALERSGFRGAQMQILDALLKLRQVCCDPALLRDDAAEDDGACQA